MKTYTLDEVQDALIGKVGTQERASFESNLQIELKTVKTFDPSNLNVETLIDKFDETASMHGFNLTKYLDDKISVDFNQADINEMVLWKTNRYVNIGNSDWFESFNKLKDITALEENKTLVRGVLTKMLDTNGIRLPMASTFLRFRNPEIFQVIDARTFWMFFGGDDKFKEIEKKYNSSKADPRIDVYFEYLERLRKYCSDNNEVKFFYADRIFYQYDIEEKQKLIK